MPEAYERFMALTPDEIMERTAIVLDRALRVNGKRDLSTPDENGVTPLDTVIGPLRRHYEEWVNSGQHAEDYIRDPSIPEREKESARFWTTGLMDNVDPVGAMQAQSRIADWAYRKYATRVAAALWSYAQQQGLSAEDTYRGLSPEFRQRAEKAAEELRAALRRQSKAVADKQTDPKNRPDVSANEADEELRRLL